ncbi:MAG: hypothetical protein KDD44_10485, partial [Bdellovibrionales bacterium]|nr:hypothetical protein [Bdellovibrionales bacterium]
GQAAVPGVGNVQFFGNDKNGDPQFVMINGQLYRIKKIQVHTTTEDGPSFTFASDRALVAPEIEIVDNLPTHHPTPSAASVMTAPAEQYVLAFGFESTVKAGPQTVTGNNVLVHEAVANGADPLQSYVFMSRQGLMLWEFANPEPYQVRERLTVAFPTGFGSGNPPAGPEYTCFVNQELEGTLFDVSKYLASEGMEEFEMNLSGVTIKFTCPDRQNISFWMNGSFLGTFQI